MFISPSCRFVSAYFFFALSKDPMDAEEILGFLKMPKEEAGVLHRLALKDQVVDQFPIFSRRIWVCSFIGVFSWQIKVFF